MIRILRLIEYTYPDTRAMEADMSRWTVSAFGLQILGKNEIRSTVLMNLNWETGEDDGV